VIPSDAHDWDVPPAEARALQRRLAGRVIATGDVTDVRRVAGVDIAVGPRGSNAGRAAVVVLEWPSLRPVEQAIARADVRFPYVPGLLSFRELPLVLPAFAQLSTRPDLVIVDGQGIAHPRRFGIAAHLGVLLDIPAIGCAKSRLIGQPQETLGHVRGARTPLLDHGQVIGYEVRSKAGVKPLYVSPGHRIGPEAAVDWVLRLTAGYRLPEPARLAHQAAGGAAIAPVIHERTDGMNEKARN
jgi:deoxyribonuclease V